MRITNFFPLCIAIAIIALLIYGMSFTDNNDPKSYIYKLSEQELYLTSKKTLNLKEFEGKYYLIHLFASWCPSCHEDFPLLKQIKQSTNIPIIGIAINDKFEKLIRKTNLPYDFIAFDKDHKIMALVRNNFLPETIIINKQGIVEFRYLGALNIEEVEKNIIPTVLKNK